LCCTQHDFFFKEINIFIQQGYVKLIKSDSKDIYNMQDIYKIFLILVTLYNKVH